ncbi:MAG: hypothetical protein M3381_08135, partial [Actinomycetota bacterium]|nr:hypothetical protein [Actinomycetota bacterium]
RIYVLPPGLLELSGLALRLEAPTGRIPTPTGRGAATTVSLLVLAPPGYVAARAVGPGDCSADDQRCDVLVATDIPLDEGLAIVTYPEPTVRLVLEGPNAESTTVSVGEGDRTSRYADDGPGYND